MHALFEQTESAEAIARAAVEAACEFDNATGGPVIVHRIELNNPDADMKPIKPDSKRKRK